jgi:hypothetical protein
LFGGLSLFTGFVPPSREGGGRTRKSGSASWLSVTIRMKRHMINNNNDPGCMTVAVATANKILR